MVRGFATEAGGIALDVHAGDIIAVRGGNGSGKTSLLRLLAGQSAPLRADEVSLRIPDDSEKAEGSQDSEEGWALLAANGIPTSRLPAVVQMATQDPRDGLVGLTVEGEFRLRRRGPPGDLSAFIGRESTALSSGETRRVALSVALGPAPLCLLDEPAEGLDATRIGDLRADIASHAARGGAVVFADHSGALRGVETREVVLPGSRAVPVPPFAVTSQTSTLLAATPRDKTPQPHPVLALPPGLHVVTGPNGAGKSTLLASLAGLERPATATIAGRPAVLGRTVRFLLPHARDALTRETVADELHAIDLTLAQRRSLVPDDLLERLPLGLSGGEAQRLALCKVLGRASPAFLLDEPEVFLDGPGRAALVHLLNLRIQQGSCILAATHDADLIAAARSRIDLAGPVERT